MKEDPKMRLELSTKIIDGSRSFLRNQTRIQPKRLRLPFRYDRRSHQKAG
jgi:hypothetical protein